jgi:hypothetical protein
MIVSSAMAVLPVLRSPMISSRWPRPIGIIESIALMPVCSGSCTGWRSAMPGATMSILRVSVDGIAGPPSSGWPSGFTDAPITGVADGHFQQAAGRLDRVAFLDLEVVAEDDGADRVFFEVEDLAHRAVLELQQLAGHRARRP